MADRVDENGAAYAGSQLQIQLYVNKRTGQLDAAIRTAFGGLADATFEWRSPCADDRYAEYQDMAFLARLDLDEHADSLAQFWPKRGGPHWDALAVVRPQDESNAGVLLVEGKSYPDEMLKGAVAGATDRTSVQTIEKALAWTQGVLGVPLNTASWTGSLYQNANRLAHVCWLRSRGVRAWLVHILFTNDPRRPASVPEWQTALRTADNQLGLTGINVPFAGHVLLEAGTREELLR